MIKTVLSTLLLVGTAGAAVAQTTYVPEREYDYNTTQTIQRYDSPNYTATMGDKSRGPGATTGDSWGPDGTPGNGAPGKQDGQR
jgi:hypothetical protein